MLLRSTLLRRQTRLDAGLVHFLRQVGVCGCLEECATSRPSYNYWRGQAAGLHASAQPHDAEATSIASDFVPGGTIRQEGVAGGVRVQFETGRLASLADGACLLQIGDTQVLATASVANQQQYVQRRQNFSLPLQVEYKDRASAVGRFPGGYQRREGGTDAENLKASTVERAIAPHFPPGFLRNIQVSTAVLSADGATDPLVMAINAASAALTCSHIPWGGPLGAVRVALVGGKLLANPSLRQAALSDLNLMYVGLEDEIVMLDLQANQVPEALVLEAIQVAREEASKLQQPQLQLARALGRGKERFPLAGADSTAHAKVFEKGRSVVEGVLQEQGLGVGGVMKRLGEEKERLHATLKASGFFRFDSMRLPGSGCVSPMDLDHAWPSLIGDCVREMLFRQNLRPDGRGMIDMRPSSTVPDPLPVPHGSVLSNCGDTQVLSAVTLGYNRLREPDANPDAAQNLFVLQTIAAASNSTSDHFNRAPSRLEQQHGSALEKAFRSLLPTEQSFPFSARLNSDVLSADGSLLETAVGSAALALRAANVPVASPVVGAGVSLMGEVQRPQLVGITAEVAAGQPQRFTPKLDSWELLVDSTALEEEYEDMHMSTAGTEKGLVVVQLESRVPSVPLKAVEVGLSRARTARLDLLKMQSGVAKKDKRVGPQFGSLEIAKEHIGRLVGPGGSVLKGIEESTGAKVVIQDGGLVHFMAPNPRQFTEADKAIGSIVGNTIKEGQTYTVKVVKLQDYGAFVELPNGYQTLLHISEFSSERVRSVEDVLELGQKVQVMCLGRDNRGFVKVSMKALEAASPPKNAPRPSSPTPPTSTDTGLASGPPRRVGGSRSA